MSDRLRLIACIGPVRRWSKLLFRLLYGLVGSCTVKRMNRELNTKAECVVLVQSISVESISVHQNRGGDRIMNSRFNYA